MFLPPLTKRQLLRKLALTGTALWITGIDRSLLFGAPEIFSEEEQSDPDVQPEKLRFVPAEAEKPLQFKSKGPLKNREELAKRILTVSKSYADAMVSRATTPGQVDQFLSLFGLHIRYENGSYIPFCAAGLSFAACRAYCDLVPTVSYDPDEPIPVLKSVLTDINRHYFKPSPAVRYIMDDAKTRGTWRSPDNGSAQPGWLVIFSWRRDGVPNHIGLVDAVSTNELSTVEFNTTVKTSGSQSNGGAVARRARQMKYALGFVKTY